MKMWKKKKSGTLTWRKHPMSGYSVTAFDLNQLGTGQLVLCVFLPQFSVPLPPWVVYFSRSTVWRYFDIWDQTKSKTNSRICVLNWNMLSVKNHLLSSSLQLSSSSSRIYWNLTKIIIGMVLCIIEYTNESTLVGRQ